MVCDVNTDKALLDAWRQAWDSYVFLCLLVERTLQKVIFALICGWQKTLREDAVPGAILGSWSKRHKMTK